MALFVNRRRATSVYPCAAPASDRHSSIHMQTAPRQERGFVRREIECGIGNVVRTADAAERLSRLERLPRGDRVRRRLDPLAQGGSLDRGGSQVDTPDSLGGVIERHRAGQTDYASLGGG